MLAPDPWLETALALWQDQNLQALRALCQQKITQNPSYAQAHYLHGLTWLEEDPERTLQSYQVALQADPDHPDYLRQSAHLLRRLGRWPEALAMYRLKAEKHPQDLEAWLQLIQVLEQREEWKALNSALQDALQYFPEDLRLQEVLARLELRRYQNEAECALQNKDHSQALKAYQQAFLALRGHPWPLQANVQSPLPPPRPSLMVGRRASLPAIISKNKLQHDGEQWRYLAKRNQLPAQAQALLPAWEAWVASLESERIATADLATDTRILLETLYDAPVFWPQTAYHGPLLNSVLDFAALEAAYLQSPIPLIWFDDLLAPACLSALRSFCMSATLWRDYYLDQGYLGAFMDDGFVSPLLLQLAAALQEAFPKILGTLPLSYLWAFKYDQSSQGIRLHADQAQVNLNFWLTPDSANLDPQGGGLQVYDKAAPAEWDFQAYNDQSSQAQMQAYLLFSQAKMMRIPHRQNRAVLFHSHLIHRTDPPRFQAGYENRRINVTMLFG